MQSEGKYLLGIDVGGTSIKMAYFLKSGQLVKKWAIPTNKTDNGTHIPHEIAHSVHKELKKEGVSLRDVEGAGVGVPGFIDIESGIIDFAVNIGWKNYPLAKTLSERLHIPVTIDNDANLAAAGEFWRGAGKGSKDMICFTLGTGVGGGMIVRGDLVHGINGMAGEIGHITVDPYSRHTCNCGKRGCLETVSSATGIVNLAKEAIKKDKRSLLHQMVTTGETLTAKAVFNAAAKKDACAQNVVATATFYLGLATAHVCNVLNPQCVIVGGGVSAAGDALLRPIRQSFQQFALEKVAESTDFYIAQLGNDAGVFGAAWLAGKS